MADPVEDCIILVALAIASLLLVAFIQLTLGWPGLIGAGLGYGVGLSLYCAPLPEP